MMPRYSKSDYRLVSALVGWWQEPPPATWARRTLGGTIAPLILGLASAGLVIEGWSRGNPRPTAFGGDTPGWFGVLGLGVAAMLHLRYLWGTTPVLMRYYRAGCWLGSLIALQAAICLAWLSIVVDRTRPG